MSLEVVESQAAFCNVVSLLNFVNNCHTKHFGKFYELNIWPIISEQWYSVYSLLPIHSLIQLAKLC